MATLPAEERFGDFLLLARRHRGPLAEVFLARPIDRPRGPLVVVKRVLPGGRDDARARAEFEHEARLLESLADPRFPRLLGRGERGGRPFLVLQFLAGPTWRQVATVSAMAAKGPDWTRAVLALGLGALGGLAVLHGHDPAIVHRDVSPENLLVSPEGGVAILDLGVALVGAAALDEPIGKRAYMSPEHLAGGAIDGRADLYALGVVLWELLSGVRPNGAPGTDGALPPLSSAAPWVDRASARLVSRLMQPAPGDRPATAGLAHRAFAARLRRMGVGEPGEPVRRALSALFDAGARAAWSPDPGAWSERSFESAEERGEETTDRQAVRCADITEVVAPISR